MKKIIATITFILIAFVLIACKPDNGSNNGDDHYDVNLDGVTVSYENFQDTGDFEKNEYFLQRFTDFNIHVYFENELDLDINTVTINNIEYTKDEFEESSTNTLITLSFNTQNDTGINPFTINNFTYIKDGETHAGGIKEHDTVLIKVQARFQPVASVVSEENLVDEHILEIGITDRENLIDFDNDGAMLTVFKDDEIITTFPLELGNNTLKIENLMIDENYTYVVKGDFDILDGEGIKTVTLLEGNFKTREPLVVDVAYPEENEINFNYEFITEEVTLNKIVLELDGNLIQELPLTTRKVEDLNGGTDYELVFHYTYLYNGLEIEKTQRVLAPTFLMEMTQVIRQTLPIPFAGGGYVEIPTYRMQDEELRAIWFSTVSNIDIQKMQPGEAGLQLYKDTISLMFDNVKAANLNAVFFQIRPMNDAWYESELAPWSRYITGTEGEHPGFDVLEFAIEEAHKREIELHGWLNPYRVSNSESGLLGMHEDNFAKKNPNLWLQARNSSGALQTILDPGQPAVQDYIIDVIDEIIENYPTINGIHFDDYFYLDQSMIGENSNSPDYQTYLDNRANSNQTIAEFRIESVTTIIRDIYNNVEAFNQENVTHIKFGISPSGIWANNTTRPEGSDTRGWQHLTALYADTKAWIEEGIIHYIVPQIYWDFDLAAARYANLVHWWSGVVRDTNVDLVIGMGPYRQRDNSWPTRALGEQIRFNQLYDEVDGVSFFTYQDLVAGSPQRLVDSMNIIKNEMWINEARVPWETNIYND